MLEPAANRILARALQAGLLGWALSFAMNTQAAAAESLPASVRACAAETDRERRLDCFDREVARFPDSKATSHAAGAAPPPAMPPGKSTATAGSPPSAAPTGSATSIASTAPATSAAPAAPPGSAGPATQTAAEATGPNAVSASASTSTAEIPPAPKPESTGKPGRIAARLVSIDRAPNEMVLHLDNGQVWEELQSVAGDLSLKVGDPVTIDKRLGSYWLSGPHVSGMKVRQRS
jgi:hypothetical protein